jgi:neopullulanase
MTLVLTVRGMPQLYYGDEIGMLGNKNKFGDGDIRRDFPGGWTGDKQNAFDQKTRTKTQEEYHSFTKKILNWRKNKKVIHNGKTLHYIPENNVYVYFRTNETESVMVIINNSPESRIFELSRFGEGLKNYSIGKDIISGKEIKLKGNLEIGGKKSMILELSQK